MKEYRITIIGTGRLARHFAHYLQSLGITFHQWGRAQPVKQLESFLAESTHTLLLIPDAAIEPFIRAHPLCKRTMCVHCSGALHTPLAYGAHPLGAFSQSLYSDKFYQRLHFVIDQDAPSLDKLLPSLPNTYSRIAPHDKARYHSLCVLAGNFSAILWDKCIRELSNSYAIPLDAILPYLESNMRNIADPGCDALTGPLTRNDKATLAKNLQALDGDPFHSIYRAFVDMYAQLQKETV